VQRQLTFKQLRPITSDLQSPFTMFKVPVDIRRPIVRKKFRCGHQAVAALRKLRLDPDHYYGAEVTDNNGIKVAEIE
jgi:hypothetical protein